MILTDSVAERIATQPKITTYPEGDSGNVVAFRKAGKIMSAMTYANLEISVDFTSLFDQWKEICVTIRDQEHRLDEGHRHVVAARRKHLSREVIQVSSIFDDVKDRVKRGIVLGAVVTTLVAGAASILFARNNPDNYEYVMKMHRSRINENSKAITTLAGIQEQSLKDQLLFDELIALLDLTELWVAQTRNGFEHIVMGILIQDLVEVKGFKKSLKELLLLIKDSGYETMKDIMYRDVFMMPLTAIVDKGCVVVIVHIPMHGPGKLLDLYEYIELPWLMMVDEKPLLFSPQPGARFIALSPSSREHQELDRNTINQCHKIKNVRFCGGQRIFRHDYDHSCLGALFSQNRNGIKAFCRMMVRIPTEEVAQIDAFKFRFIIPEEDMLNVRCTDSSMDLNEKVKGIVEVVMPTSCRAETSQLAVAKSPSTEIGVAFRSHELAFSVKDVLPKHVEEWKNIERKFSKVPVHIQSLDESMFQDWPWDEICVIVVASLLAALAFYVMLLSCCRRRAATRRDPNASINNPA